MGDTAGTVVDRHLEAFASGDIKRILANYAADASIVTATKIYRGTKEIELLFSGLCAEFCVEGVEFELLFRWSDDSKAVFNWQATTKKRRYLLGTDTVAIEDGKITFQSAASYATPLA